jgi:GR25 family glycosyltransferase involved in LPS biosynthesis
MNTHVFLVNWDAVYESVLRTENQLAAAGIKYTVLDSGTQKEPKVNWSYIGDVRFYGQLYEALKRMKQEDYCIFILGDAGFDRVDSFVNRVIECGRIYNLGIFAPHYSHSPWGPAQTTLELVPGSESLVIASQTDGIATAFHKDVYTVLLEYMTYLDSQVGIVNLRTGWGMDYIWCAISVLLGKYIIRDTHMIAHHPHGSSYNHNEAAQEMALVMGIYSQWSGNSERVEYIYDQARRKMSQDPTVTARSLYGDAALFKDAKKLLYHIICISDERRHLVDKAHSILGYNWLIIETVNAYNENSKLAFVTRYPEVKNLLYKVGEFGCFASHYVFWKYIVDNNIEQAVVLEDDADVQNHFPSMYQLALNLLPSTYDVFSMYVDKNQYPRFNESFRINNYIARGYQDWSTLSYIVSLKGAKRLIELVETNGMDQPVDWFIFRNGHQNNLEVYTWTPSVAVPVAIDSNTVPQIKR